MRKVGRQAGKEGRKVKTSYFGGSLVFAVLCEQEWGTIERENRSRSQQQKMASRPRRSAASTATGSATSTPSGTPKGTPNKTKAVSSGSTSASGTPRSSARKRVASHSSTPSKSTPSKSTPTSKSNGKTNGSSSSKTGTKTKARKEVKRSSPAIIFKDDLESEEETTPSVDEDDSEDEYRDEEGAGGKGADGEDDDDDEDEEFDDDEDDDEEDDDDDDDYGGAGGKRSKARGKPIAKARPVKKRKKLEDDEDDEDDAGMTEVIEVVAAPREKISKGRVSPHLVGFLKSLKDPAKNDRDWFARHKNIYDYIYANWLQFVEAATEEFMEHVDDTIPWLPPKDLIERIYRDVRFSNDKTPYKTHLSMCLSRNGRKVSLLWKRSRCAFLNSSSE